MNLPSFDFFVIGPLEREDRREPGREPAETLREGGKGDGRDEAEVRARWWCRPSGSFLLVSLDSKMTEPGFWKVSSTGVVGSTMQANVRTGHLVGILVT